MVGFYEDDGNYYIVTELFNGPNLIKNLRDKGILSENENAEIIRQLLLAINHCHKQNIFHRDIKLENVMFSEKPGSTIKLIDFGCSIQGKEEKIQTPIIGALYYIAPEMAKEIPYTTKSDIWSLGIFLNTLFNSTYGYDNVGNMGIQELFKEIKVKTFSIQNDMDIGPWQDVSRMAKNFALKMLQNDPKERSTASELLTETWLRDLTYCTVSHAVTQKIYQNLKKSSVFI